MTASALQSTDLGSCSRSWWLPAGSLGDDLDDDACEAVLLGLMPVLTRHRDSGSDRA
jgi:hypothetical protein